MPTDLVRPLKMESPTTGGTETDLFPSELDPAEDYIAVKGVALEGNINTTISISNGNITFKDGDHNNVSLHDVSKRFIWFTRAGQTSVGTYMRLGEINSSSPGFPLFGNYKIRAMIVTNSNVVNNACRIQVLRRTGAETYEDITDAYIDLPASNYRAVKDNMNVQLNSNDEIAIYLKSGQTMNNVIVQLVLIPS
jgi:hypothetical protein